MGGLQGWVVGWRSMEGSGPRGLVGRRDDDGAGQSVPFAAVVKERCKPLGELGGGEAVRGSSVGRAALQLEHGAGGGSG